ncbi:MAG: peptidyl-prolyl cis-trans isomerase [Ignavibacteriaceae bacterium]
MAVRFIFILFISLVVISGCGGDNEDKSYRARVENSILTDEEIKNSVADDSLSRNTFIKNWIHSELFYLEALDNDVQNDPELKKLIEKSKKELINSFWIRKFLQDNKIVPSESELRAFYKEQSDLFTLNDDAFIVDIITFPQSEKGWEFRDAVLDGDWKSGVDKMVKDSALTREFSSQLIYSHDVTKGALLRVIQSLSPGEVSPVIPDDARGFTVVRLVQDYPKGSIPDFELITKDVERAFIEWKLKDRLDEYTGSLYSKYDIEIK